MLKLKDRVQLLERLGDSLKGIGSEDDFRDLYEKAHHHNGWFTPDNILFSTNVWGNTLTAENLTRWISAYPVSDHSPGKVVGVINAGNMPFVGLHDLLSVFLAGHRYLGKNAAEDQHLLPMIAGILTGFAPQLQDYFRFVDKLSGMDAVIATGSNNSSGYFEYYFRKYPHLVRKNRNAVAVLSGRESKEDFEKLGEDIFRYFGLGCRNISKVYVPEGYSFNAFFEGIEGFHAISNHNKYISNFEYNNAMFLLKRLPFLQNGFLIVREEERIASPVAVLHYEQYRTFEQLSEKLDDAEQEIQCVVTSTELGLESYLKNRVVGFGMAQSPSLWDYADGVDTIEFLTKIK